MSRSSPTRPQRRFETRKFYFNLLRLTDEEYRKLRARSFRIQYKDWFLVALITEDARSLNLPKLLVLLEQDFGRSSDYFDSYKQGFAFPFLLEIQKAIGSLYYLLTITDYRGGIEFHFYRVMDTLDYVNQNPNLCHPPLEHELSEAEIEYMVTYLWGFYEGYGKSYFESRPHITPFFRSIPSSGLVYGYWDNDFVEQFFEYEDENERDILLAELEKKYGESSKSELDRVCLTKELILKILAS